MREPIGSGRTTSMEGISWVTGAGSKGELSTSIAGIAIATGIFTITVNMNMITVVDVGTTMNAATVMATVTSMDTMTRSELFGSIQQETP